MKLEDVKIGGVYVFYREATAWHTGAVQRADGTIRLELEVLEVTGTSDFTGDVVCKVLWSPDADYIGRIEDYSADLLKPLDPLTIGGVFNKLIRPLVSIYEEKVMR